MVGVEIHQELRESRLLVVEALEAVPVLRPWVADLSVHQVRERRLGRAAVVQEVQLRVADHKDQAVEEVAAAGRGQVVRQSEVRTVQDHAWEVLLVPEAVVDACQVAAEVVGDRQSDFEFDELEVHLELMVTLYGLGEHSHRLRD